MLVSRRISANILLIISFINDGIRAYNSTATLDISLHRQLPPGFTEWVIVSSRGCCHREHIDPAGSCTLIHVLRGSKLFLLGYPRNASAFSWNASEGHCPASASVDVLYEPVLLEAGDYLYVINLSIVVWC